MTKKVLIGLGIVGVLIVIIAAAYVLRPAAEASAPIEAVPLQTESTNKPATSSEGQPETSAEEMAQAEVSAPEGVFIFTILPNESEVRFTLNELLSGVPTTVIGVTDQVAGEVAIDPENPANSKVGVILVNARTLVTDSNFRNRAINNEILETDEFEFITFTPTSIAGFPENPVIGVPLEFQISGDLTIRDITNEVTFDVTVTAVSETRLEGSASAMVARADYKLVIPEVPRVANVDEEVLLEIDFVATIK